MTTGIARFVAVLVVLGLAGAAIAGLIALRTPTPVQPPGDTRPVVRVAVPERGEVRLDVDATGTVMAYGRLTLSAEVAGRITWIAPSLDAGVSVAAEAELLRIETVDLEAAVARAAADVATARVTLAQEAALASEAERDLELLATDVRNDFARRQPQLAAARARLDAQQAALTQAQRDLERSTVRAPLAAVIEARQVEVGQLVTRGQTLLQLRSAAVLEAHLPVTVEDLALLQMPLISGEQIATEHTAPTVTLATSDGRQAHGRVVRTTGVLDATTRLATVVVVLPGTADLVPGDFVHATIAGSRHAIAVIVPRHLLRRDGTLLLVDAQDQLLEHPVQILRLRREEAVLVDDLPADTRLVLNRLEGWSTGSRVRIAGAATP